MNQPDELLTISQAAEILQVSQISLRRWTNSGRLKCYRLGARRERRFKRQDLQDFLDRGTENPVVRANENGSAPGAGFSRDAAISFEGITIEYGKHLCSLYESDMGQLKMSVPFLADGLRQYDVCYLVASQDVCNAISSALKKVFDGFDAAIDQSQLIISTGEDSADQMYEYFEKELVKSTQSGQRSVRVLGDMAWFLDRRLDFAELVKFEQRFNHALAHQFPLVSLCQYDVRRFSGTDVLNALKCHEDTFAYPLSRFLGI